MINAILQIKTQLQEIWGKTSRTQKIVIIVLPLLVFITLSIFIIGASQPDYQTLATYKDIQDAAAVKNKLDEQKISYKLSDNGMTILVPSKDLDTTRLAIASAGLPTGGVVGWEIFDQQKFGETDTDRKAKFIRAIEGELTRTIKSLDGVQDARVQVVMPEQSLYSDEQKDATASIMLKLDPYKKIEDNQIIGLVHLVCGSVEGLKPENVTVVDTNMNDLTDGLDLKNDQTSPSKLTVTQFQFQQDYQKDIQKSIQSMLENIYGPGKAVVRVKADLDFDQVQKTSEQYTGDPKVRSEQISEETSKGTSTSPGTPGTTSNIPGYQQVNGSTITETDKSDKTRNYEIDKTVENRVVSPGSIKKLSVAVVVDGQINTQQKQDIENLVKSAGGIDTTRGDQVAVTSMQFDTKYQDDLKKQMDSQAAMGNYLLFGALGVIALIVVIIAFVLLRRKKSEEEALVTDITELGSEVDVTVDDFIGEHERELTPEEVARERIREQVEQLAQDDPDSVAQLLKTWIAEE